MRPLLLVSLTASLAVAAAASDWPTYKHGLTRNAATGDSLNSPVALRWSFLSPAPPELAWPGPGGKTIEELTLLHRVRFDDVFHTVIADGRVYFGSSVDHHVYCIDGTTGEIAWTFCTGGPVRVAPTVADGRVYVGSDDGFAYCLDAASGALIWQRRAGTRDERILARGKMSSRWPVRTSVLVDDGVAYFGAGTFPHETVYLYAVDAKSGEVIWKNDAISQQDAGRNDLTPQGYLLASEELLFVPSGRTLPAAIDRQTGRLVHKQRGGGKQVGGTDVVLTGNQIYTIGEHEILATDQRAGEILQKLPARQIVIDGEIAYIASKGMINAVEHETYAKVFADGSLRRKVDQLEIELRGHEAVRLQQRIAESTQELARLNSERKELSEAGQRGSEVDRGLAAEVAEFEKARAEASAALPAAAVDFNAKLQEAFRLRGIRWRTSLPHEASLIAVGNAIIAGGEGEIAALSRDDGKLLWRQQVDGTARGLAFADGLLTVSTTSGGVYCFGDATHQTQPAVTLDADPTPAVATDSGPPDYAAAAEKILAASGVDRGFCLVVGSEEGHLAAELADQSPLKMYCVEADFEKVQRSRERFRQAGLYGTRVVVDHVDLSRLPHPNYFANLVVSDSLLRGNVPPSDPEFVARHVKPIGGVVCLLPAPEQGLDRARQWLEATGLLREGATLETREGCAVLTRAALPGTDSWTHQHGNAANTSSTNDQRVQGGLSVLWYGDPGPSHMLNRHAGAVGPVSSGGRLFIQGEKTVMAYDAYNGEFQWEVANSGAIRTGVFNNYEPGHLVASEDRVYNVIDDTCLELDAATGDILRKYAVPNPSQDPHLQWGYLAYNDGILYGTSTRRELVPPEERNLRGRPANSAASDRIFAYDTLTGGLLWEYEGKSISHTAVAIGGERVVFIESSITPAEREELLQQDKTELRDLTGKEREIAEQRLKEYDFRRAVAIDARTGEELWSQAVDVTDCSGVGTGAGQLAIMVHDGFVVLCGANANGHYWEQFLSGEFARRRLVVLSAETGDRLWARDANYRHRPIVVGARIIAEPWAFELATGAPVMRTHPLTGEETPWMFIRPGHHCGAISATPSMLFFRSGFTAYYDLEQDSGTHHFGGHRLGCWINTIPAGGLVLIPEASAGCACLFSLTSTIAFEPRHDSQQWGVFAAQGEMLPINHLALNLGAPGDRRDASGKLWLSYPRPSSRERLDLPIQLEAQFTEGGQFVQHNADSFEVEADVAPWVYASGASKLLSCRLPLTREGDTSWRNYDVTLHFVAEATRSETTPIAVWLQGDQVATELRMPAGEQGHATLTKTFPAIPVQGSLEVKIMPTDPTATPPVLAAIELNVAE